MFGETTLVSSVVFESELEGVDFFGFLQSNLNHNRKIRGAIHPYIASVDPAPSGGYRLRTLVYDSLFLNKGVICGMRL